VPGGYCDIQCSVHCISLIAVSFIALVLVLSVGLCVLCVCILYFDGLLVFVRDDFCVGCVFPKCLLFDVLLLFVLLFFCCVECLSDSCACVRYLCVF